jgi:acyl carrier protein
MEEIELKVKTIISRQLGINIGDIQNENKFVHDLKGDSLDTVEMLLTVEDEFGFEIDEDTDESIETVQMVIDLIRNLKKIS